MVKAQTGTSIQIRSDSDILIFRTSEAGWQPSRDKKSLFLLAGISTGSPEVLSSSATIDINSVDLISVDENASIQNRVKESRWMQAGSKTLVTAS